MDNIFTFDLEDNEEIDDIPEYPPSHQQPNEHQHPKKLIQAAPYVFDDFDQDQSQNIQKFEQGKSPLQPLEKLDDLEEYSWVKKGSEDQGLQSRTNFSKRFSEQCGEEKENRKSKGCLRGVEIEDLNVREMEYVCEKKAIKVTDLRKFLNTPLGQYKVKAIIKKQNGGLFNTKTKYSVYIEQNNKFLMTVLRDGFSEYIFSLSKENVSTKNKNYLGSLTGNISGTDFFLFDSGFSPKETRSLEQCRKQLASIKYEESKGPRKFETIISTNAQGFYALEPDEDVLLAKWESKEREFLSRLYSRSPQFDSEDGNYKLDFKGIVKKPSVKNFILGGLEWQDSLIFGKIDDETFVMEIKQPFSVLQATAICVSSIQYKLHWN